MPAVIASSAAFTSNAKSPSVMIVIGSVRMRRIVPRTALTMPKIAATPTRAKKPPVTFIPVRIASVSANARVRTAHRRRK